MDSILAGLGFAVFGWVSTLTGVGLGGWLVYRTKRESYDPLIGAQPKGEVFNLEPDEFKFPDMKSSAKLPKATAESHDRFTEQFAEELAKGAGNGNTN